jgi:hypothetical protein
MVEVFLTLEENEFDLRIAGLQTREFTTRMFTPERVSIFILVPATRSILRTFLF